MLFRSEHVRAAVTVALDGSLESMVSEITHRVLAALRLGNVDARTGESRLAEAGVAGPGLAPARSEPPKPAVPQAPAAQIEPVRRVSPLRFRTGSILGLDISRPEPPSQDPE